MEEGALQEGRRPPHTHTFMTTSAVPTLQRVQAFLGLAASPRARLLLTCETTGSPEPVVQGSISLKLVLFFFFLPGWNVTGCPFSNFFWRRWEVIGFPKFFFFFFYSQFPFGDQRPNRSGLSCREQNVRSITTAVWS